MARVTVEDCVKLIPNRFDLVLIAAKRTRDILAGAPITLSRDNDKNPVIALREIAQQSVSIEVLHGSIIKSFQKNAFSQDYSKESIDTESQELMFLDSEQKNVIKEDLSGLHIDDEDTLDLEDDETI